MLRCEPTEPLPQCAAATSLGLYSSGPANSTICFPRLRQELAAIRPISLVDIIGILTGGAMNVG